MDRVGILFVIVMVILSGVIAYLGDLLGRYLGKKRKTIFGLRPRHFAALATGLAGAFAAGMVILVLSLVSAPIKQFIIEGNRAQRQLDATQKRLDAAQKELDDTDALRDKAEDSLAEAERKLTEAENRLAAEVSNVEDARRLAAGLRDQVGALKGQVTSFERDLKVSRGELSSTRNNLILVQKELAEAEDQQASTLKITTDLLKQNQQMDQDLRQADQELTAKQNEVENLQAQVEGLQKSIDTLQNQYQEDLANNREALRVAREELNTANRDLETARTNLNDVQQVLDKARNLILFNNAAARYSRLIANSRDELVRIPIAPQMTQAEARIRLREALENASTEARILGASARDGAPGVFADLDTRTDNGLPNTVQAVFDLTVIKMSGGIEPRFMILRTPINTFVGEYIPLEAEFRANPVIYEAGETIMETRIDGSKSDDEVAGAISDFVTSELQREVLRDGVIPAIGKPSPLGELSRETILRMVEGLRRANRTMTVAFITQKQVRAGDRLQLDFRLRP